MSTSSSPRRADPPGASGYLGVVWLLGPGSALCAYAAWWVLPPRMASPAALCSYGAMLGHLIGGVLLLLAGLAPGRHRRGLAFWVLVAHWAVALSGGLAGPLLGGALEARRPVVLGLVHATAGTALLLPVREVVLEAARWFGRRAGAARREVRSF